MPKKYKKFDIFNMKKPITETQRSKLRRARDDEDLIRRMNRDNISLDKQKMIDDVNRLRKAIKYLNKNEK